MGMTRGAGYTEGSFAREESNAAARVPGTVLLIAWKRNQKTLESRRPDSDQTMALSSSSTSITDHRPWLEMSASMIRWNALEGIAFKNSLKLEGRYPPPACPSLAPRTCHRALASRHEKTSWSWRNVNNPLRAQYLQMSAQSSSEARLWLAAQAEAIPQTGE